MTDAPIAKSIPTSRAFDSVDLFLYSSAVRLAHRIHYDRDFARDDGHRGLVVPGTLQAAWLIEVAAETAAARGKELHSLTYRNVGIAIEGETLEIQMPQGDLSAESLEISLVNTARDTRTTRAVATFR